MKFPYLLAIRTAAVFATAILFAAAAPSPAVQALREPTAQTPDVNTPLGDRAMEIVHALADAIGSRPAGTAAERTAASFLADQYQAMGYGVDVVPFSFSTRAGSGTSQNVIAYDPNEDPNVPLVIIGGHYDTVPAGPGANDNGSGTAALRRIMSFRKCPIRVGCRTCICIWQSKMTSSEAGISCAGNSSWFHVKQFMRIITACRFPRA